MASFTPRLGLQARHPPWEARGWTRWVCFGLLRSLSSNCSLPVPRTSQFSQPCLEAPHGATIAQGQPQVPPRPTFPLHPNTLSHLTPKLPPPVHSLVQETPPPSSRTPPPGAHRSVSAGGRGLQWGATWTPPRRHCLAGTRLQVLDSILARPAVGISRELVGRGGRFNPPTPRLAPPPLCQGRAEEGGGGGIAAACQRQLGKSPWLCQRARGCLLCSPPGPPSGVLPWPQEEGLCQRCKGWWWSRRVGLPQTSAAAPEARGDTPWGAQDSSSKHWVCRLQWLATAIAGLCLPVAGDHFAAGGVGGLELNPAGLASFPGSWTRLAGESIANAFCRISS